MPSCLQTISCVLQEPFLFPLAERETVLELQRERRSQRTQHRSNHRSPPSCAWHAWSASVFAAAISYKSNTALLLYRRLAWKMNRRASGRTCGRKRRSSTAMAGVMGSFRLRATVADSDLPNSPEGSRGFLPLSPFFGVQEPFLSANRKETVLDLQRPILVISPARKASFILHEKSSRSDERELFASVFRSITAASER